MRHWSWLGSKIACVHAVESAWYHQSQSPVPEALLSERKCSQPSALLLCKFLISHKDSGSQGTEIVSAWPGPMEEAQGLKSPHLKEYFHFCWSWRESKYQDFGNFLTQHHLPQISIIHYNLLRHICCPYFPRRWPSQLLNPSNDKLDW